MEERLGSSPNTADAERQFVWGKRYIDDLAMRDRDTDNDGSLDERLYGHQDANWNMSAVIDETGVVEERYAQQSTNWRLPSAFSVDQPSTFNPRPF